MFEHHESPGYKRAVFDGKFQSAFGERSRAITGQNKESKIMTTVLKFILVVFLLLFGAVEDGKSFKRILRTTKVRIPKLSKHRAFDCRLHDRDSPRCKRAVMAENSDMSSKRLEF